MNYYDELEIKIDANEEEIKKAFRKLSLRYHPDKNNKTREKFNNITKAYEILKDKHTRSIYDKTLQKSDNNENNVLITYDENVKKNVSFNENDSVLNKDFLKPECINMDIVLTLEDAFLGKNIPISVNRIIKSNNKEYNEKETIYIEIPSGIDDNEIITLNNKGNEIIYNNIVIKGDVKIFVKIDNKSKFKRDGLDLYYIHEIKLKEALCGFSFNLLYLDGKTYKFDNNKIINFNTEKKINNMGMKRGNSKGSLIIKFNIMFPLEISNKILEQLKSIDF